MIRIERDPEWWVAIASHPALAGALMGLRPEALAPLIALDGMMPVAAEHGGFLFAQLDGLGFVRELHTLFTPEGWGREVAAAGKQALGMLFDGPCRALTTVETAENPASRPPRSFGFQQIGDWSETTVGEARPWLLTKEAWTASPARRRMH